MATAKKTSPAGKRSGGKTVSRRAAGGEASDAIDAQLARYRSMRDFSVTAEPSGKPRKRGSAAEQGLPFVIQKHAASHLHYDVRLGWNGVLKSWACAKGPSYNPADRRLAVQVEDHPMEYGGFEGVIPAGQYGGGTVMLWDEGRWEPQAGHEDVDAGLRDGALKFTLHGTKMKGAWTLVRMGGKAANEKKPNWLLIKEHDGLERAGTERPVTEAAPDSVLTQRSLDEIARAGDHVWNSKDTAKGNAWHRVATNSKRPSKAGKTREDVSPKEPFVRMGLNDLPKEELPSFIAPQLAAAATDAPSTEGWLHELKLDGYRIQCRIHDGKAELLTRNGLDWTHRMKAIAGEAAKLPVESAVMDGEVVVLGADGNSSFADLQAFFQDGAKKEKSLTYFAFDLLHLNGRNLRGLPLVERKAFLAEAIKGSAAGIAISEHLDADATVIFNKACELGAEGIVSKRRDSPYISGRSSSWLKLKCIHEQEFVVGGFTLPAKGHTGVHGIGSLLLGYYDDGKRLIYAGRTGTGFTRKTHDALRTRLEGIRAAASAFYKPPAEARKGAVWVAPELVAQVRFATWTADGLLRQAAFQGLREDKAAGEVRREESAAGPEGGRKASGRARRVVAERALSPARKTRRNMPGSVRLTHPGKVLDEESGLTKQQLAEYYWAIAPRMLPHIVGRPLSLVRCPEGSGKQCFFQKHTSGAVGEGIETVEVPNKKTGKPEPYISLSTPEALAGLAQMSVLEVHPWGSRSDDLERPDRLIFDLDPDPALPWTTLAAAAAEVRERLERLGLQSFLKSTGGKGLHVVVPIAAEHGWDTIKEFCHRFVLEMERESPSIYLTKMTKSARTGRIYLDYLRNERGATAVAAYSPRARAGAPVSLPLRWSDLKLASLPVFHISDYASWSPRLSRDPWKGFLTMTQRLPGKDAAG
jgi:bifunctional non-homologous end joining protein LigD